MTRSAPISLPASIANRPQAAITIVGLGPGCVDDLSLAGWQALSRAERIILRTVNHPCVDELTTLLDVPMRACDDLYEALEHFDQVYRAIVNRVLETVRTEGPVVYAVPGHPWVGEATTRLLLDAARSQNFSLDIIGSSSFVEPSFAAAGVDLMDGSQVVDAMLLAREYHPRLETGLPLLVAQLYARWLASDVKLTLQNAYPNEYPVTLLCGAGTPQARQITVPLAELDQADHFDHLTTLYVPPLDKSSFTDLQEIVARLRAPDGCPWDREQTLDSLRHDLLSETAEVLEAIDAEADGRDNSEHIAEELGDVLLTVSMLIQIATEEGRFQLADVIRHVVTKLIRRHPHVFGDVTVDGVDAVFTNWDAIKAQEKADKGEPVGHPLDGVPAALPALEKARELQSKAAKAGLLDRAALARENPAVTALLEGDLDEQRAGRLLWQLTAALQEQAIVPENALRSYAGRYREEAKQDGN
ncbi:MAG: MazG family protein [Caldilineaceae bacterium]|nr:MazG family protein [Caldilineaceae bacterium]